MKRPLTLLLLGALVKMATAQAPQTFLVRSSTVMDTWTQKMVAHVILEREPSAMLSFDTGMFKVRTIGPHSGEELVRALNDAGMGTFQLIVDRQAGSGDPFPVKVDTGDPSQDAINYSIAKSAWVAAHPEAYDAMISDPRPVVRDHPTPTLE